MKNVCFLLLVISCAGPLRVQAQPTPVYSLLLKGGHVIDPKNKIDGVMDVALNGDKIAKVAKDIPIAQVTKVINVAGAYITPGLIDLHTHVFVGPTAGTFANGVYSLSPDDFTFESGVTTVVDAGTSGWRNFALFKQQVIDQSLTRVLAFLNIAGGGMSGFPTEEDINDMDARMTSLTIQHYPDLIVGVKIGHYHGSDWAPFDRALEAGKTANVPIIIEAHLPKLSLEEMLRRMRPGDIFSQSFKKTSAERLSVVDDEGKLRPYVLEAQKRGILFDVGHGGGSFHFSAAIPAYKQGLIPTSFGTDLHYKSMNSGMKDILNVMSKYMTMGMTLSELISRATWQSATAIKHPELGHLSEGAVADVAILSIRDGRFGFLDAANTKLEGTKKLECEVTIRAGKVVYDLNGMASTTSTPIR